MTTNLSTNEIVQYSTFGFIILVAIGIGFYHKKYSNDPICKIDDNKPITVKNHYDNEASGLSRRKKSHTKSKRSRRRSKK